MSNQFRQTGGHSMMTYHSGYPFDAQGSVALLNSYFDVILPAYFGVLKRWNGSSWVKAKLKTYGGVSFDIKPLKVYDGSIWQLVDNNG